MAKKHSLVNNKGKKSCRHQEPGLTIDIGCSYSSTLGIYIGSPWHLIKRAVAGQLRLWLPHHLCTSAEGTAWRSFEHAYPDWVFTRSGLQRRKTSWARNMLNNASKWLKYLQTGLLGANLWKSSCRLSDVEHCKETLFNQNSLSAS